jgi:hypothetical protein
VAEKHPDVEFGIVIARKGRRLRSATRRAAGECGIGSRVAIASERDGKAWRPWLAQAMAAVELADAPQLGPSDFLIESVAAGAPTVVSGIGAMRELPHDVVARIPGGASVTRVAGEILGLIEDQRRSALLRTRARSYAEENSADSLAQHLVRSLGLEEAELEDTA